ncbi:MAG: glycoside hydrolase family 92 protein, partial [Chlorobi bacterium]|nr:glycoside hydrolase family 92 protein [Chlorobiota bacterium]
MNKSKTKIYFHTMMRLSKMKLLMAFITSAFVTFMLAGCAQNSETSSNLDYVDPNIGGVAQLLKPTRPNIQLPNQMIRMFPIRADYIDDQISFFPLTHIGENLFGIMPYVSTVNDAMWKNRQAYDHDLETVRPYYYYTYFIDSEIQTEYTPGSKTGYYKFTFPSKSRKLVKLQINFDGEWDIISGNTISGVEVFEGMRAFVYGEFNIEGNASLDQQTTLNVKSEAGKQEPVALFEFVKEENQVVEFKYGISFISIEQAKANLDKEIPDWNFESLKNKGKKIWEKDLDRIQVKGGTKAQRRTFYTALYRTYGRMVTISEDGKYYSAYDHKVHKSDRNFYVDDGVWDTYLAMHPLRMLLDPAIEADMLQSYVDMYEQSGWMPQFPKLYGDGAVMNGFHSTIVFLDAWRKGIRNYDVEKAYEGMKKNAEEATMLPWRNGPKMELDYFYRENGFYPALEPGEKETYKEVDSFEKRESVAVTLAHSYDDWALAEMAKELSKKKDYDYFIAESKNYKNLYRSSKKMFWPKNSKGEWIEIDPKFDGGPGGRDYYDENNGYTYAWQVQHDIHGLINLMGGRKEFISNLDQLFREDLGRRKFQFWAKFPDATGLVGQFSMGNEPSFHIPYL